MSVVCPHRRYLKNTDLSEDPGEARIYETLFIRFGRDGIFGRDPWFPGTLVNKISYFFSKIIARILQPIQIPDRSMPWIPIAVVECLHVVRKFRPDVIYVSCPEFGANIAGAIVQKITRIPLVIDYDDPWHLSDNK